MPDYLKKFKSFVKIPLREKLWFIILYILSGFLRLAILILPFRWLVPFFGTPYENTQLCVLVTQQQLDKAWRIGSITNMAAKYTPWKSQCLVQAAIAKVFLNYYQIPYVMYIGVMRDKEDKTGLKLKAHAWLSVGRWIITGADGHKTFTVASSFVAPSVLKNQSEKHA